MAGIALPEFDSLSRETIYNVLSLSCGWLGGGITIVLVYEFGIRSILGISLGLNVTLFFWAYVLYEGWHQEENREIGGEE